MKVTLFLEVVSSWCHWVEPTWARLRAEFGDRVEFDWKVALMDPSGLPASRAQCDWFYRRSGTLVRSPYMLSSEWFEPGLSEYLAPNLVPEAARELGIHADRARLAIAEGAVLRGLKVAEVPIVFTDREQGSSKMSRAIAVEAAWMVWKLLLENGLRRRPSPEDFAA